MATEYAVGVPTEAEAEQIARELGADRVVPKAEIGEESGGYAAIGDIRDVALEAGYVIDVVEDGEKTGAIVSESSRIAPLAAMAGAEIVPA